MKNDFENSIPNNNIIGDEKTTLQKPAEKLLDSINWKYLRIDNSPRSKYRNNTNVKMKGYPDLNIPLPDGHTIYIEFKMPGKELEKDQIEWKEFLIKNKQPYVIIYYFDDFIRLLIDCGILEN